jgi:hypothetical protein
MDHYAHLIEDDDAPDVTSELSELAWRAGYGAALLSSPAPRKRGGTGFSTPPTRWPAATSGTTAGRTAISGMTRDERARC